MNLETIIATKRQNSPRLLNKQNVVACGVGFKNDTEEPCVVVSVTKKVPAAQLAVLDTVPGRLGEVATDVVEVGRVRALQHQDRLRPAPGGVSVGHINGATGTLGCLVGKDGSLYILSNCHVLAECGDAVIGDSIIQPGCFSEDTRVLTEDGLKFFFDLTPSDRIATLNLSNESIEYQSPTKIHAYPYQGKMVQFRGQMYNFLVTPNHQLVVKTEHKGVAEIVIAEEVVLGYRKVYDEARRLQSKLGNCYRKIGSMIGVNPSTVRGWLYYGRAPGLKHRHLQFLKTGLWNGAGADAADKYVLPQEGVPHFKQKSVRPVPLRVFLDFLGRWLSEGSLGGPGACARGNYRISIRNMEAEFLDKTAVAFRAMGLSPHIRYEHGSVTAASKQLHDYLLRFGHAADKYVPKWIKALPVRYLEVLIQAMLDGDGSHRPGGGKRYYTMSRRLAEDVVEIGLKCGWGVSISQDSRGLFVVGLSKRNLTPRITNEPHLVDYEGMVYDVTVPNGTLMVEREGKLTWSGNSHDGGSGDDIIATLADFIPINFGEGPSTCPIARAMEGVFNRVAVAIGSSHRLVAWREVPDVNLVDAAVARPISNDLVKKSILAIGEPKGIREVLLGQEVQKSGRTTGHTVGQITQIHVDVRVGYGAGRSALFEDQLMAGAMSKGGDSGSAVLDMDGYVVGLLFAGSDVATIMNPIQAVMKALNVQIA